MAELRARYRGTARSVRDARNAVVEYARLCGFPSRVTVDIALAVGEALANAVEHGNKDAGFIELACRFEGGTLIIEVQDGGTGFDVERVVRRQREPHSVRGFGITIMESLMDTVEYGDRGRFVRLHKRLGTEAHSAQEEQRA
jgi:anti-sigma regulatory factor (Ser/Thr protein kinase)